MPGSNCIDDTDTKWMKESTRQRLQILYDEAVQALAGGDDDRALQRLKDIYEVDYTFRDIAAIVEAAYMTPEQDWIAEFRKKIAEESGR